MNLKWKILDVFENLGGTKSVFYISRISDDCLWLFPNLEILFQTVDNEDCNQFEIFCRKITSKYDNISRILITDKIGAYQFQIFHSTWLPNGTAVHIPEQCGLLSTLSTHSEILQHLVYVIKKEMEKI